MITEKDVLAALSRVPGPDGQMPLPQSGASGICMTRLKRWREKTAGFMFTVEWIARAPSKWVSQTSPYSYRAVKLSS